MDGMPFFKIGHFLLLLIVFKVLVDFSEIEGDIFFHVFQIYAHFNSDLEVSMGRGA